MNKQTLGKFNQNASPKKGIVVCLLTATILVLMVGMASSAGTQWWHLKDTGGATGADYEMQKGSGHGDNYVAITDESLIWSSNEAASIAEGVSFGTGTWHGVIDYTGEASEGFLDNGETMKLEIGSLSPGGVFTPAMEMTDTDYHAATIISVAPGSEFIVPNGHYIALKLTVTGYVRVDVSVSNGGSSSYIKSPSVDPGYPVPELSTLVLLSFGLLALFGYVVYRRRNGKAQ